ncbi:alginate O-acetyltransferase AlgX-related protein [Roseococcus sp. YIM B11640]|uniref:alginate O-acetyltransferase AlgX-related protein n=1 Tax=Roseococcus sp. YIM B11640 TaxID=3133973 RepID=UPI003C7D8BB6
MASVAQAQSALVDIGTEGWLFPAWDRINRLDVEAMRRAVQGIIEAVTIIRGGRMDVVLLVIPSKKRLMRRFLPGAQVAADIDRRYTMILQEGRRAQAVVPDLDTLFRETMGRDPRRVVFFKTDTHWTPVGAEVAAVETARLMREQLGMPASQKPGVRLGDLRPMTLAQGDLLTYVPAAQRANFGREESWVRQVLPAQGGGGGLLESDDADVAVVGTSNMQPRFAFTEVLSNQLSRPVNLQWRTNNYGPYYVLLEYLRSEGFRRQRPRAIVWNLLEIDMINASNSSSWGQFAMPPANFISELRRLVAV